MGMKNHTNEQLETRPATAVTRVRDTAADRAAASSPRTRATTPPRADVVPRSDVPDLVCFSHLRWDLVFQRPQHLLTRCAAERRVFFVEEPVFDDGPLRYEVHARERDVQRVVFHLPRGLDEAAILAAQRELVDALYAERRIRAHVLWYYTPMALPFTRHLKPLAVVYDCMDELSAFAGAPPALRQREAELLARADLVLTGGQSLYESKRHRHPQVYAFPSSVDVTHFARARRPQPDPDDQAAIPRPRIGFFGVLDERLDIDLLRGVAAERSGWHFVLLGPVVKIDPAVLPVAANIHYLGPKAYQDLPSYLAGWDVAILPFARNDATRFISPTKTPEYLAAGCPVVSTSIRDVVRPYGQQGLARIADDVPGFAAAIDAALREDAGARRDAADAFLRHMSWDDTWARMRQLVDAVVGVKQAVPSGGRPRMVLPASAREP